MASALQTTIKTGPRSTSSSTAEGTSPQRRSESKTKKIVTVVGARPQFIKAAPVSEALAAICRDLREDQRIAEMVVHTGQHYDSNMSANICSQLGVSPVRNLGINGGSHGEQTAAMIRELEKLFLAEAPEIVLLYGDTNSTVAGALAAAKLGITLAHVEAGLRSFNRAMPEEVNRVITDHVANILFSPTETAVSNLLREGIKENVFLVGDVMYDAVQQNLKRARRESSILAELGVQKKSYVLVTIHRAENTTGAEQLQRIASALVSASASRTIVWPMHPRTRQALERAKIPLEKRDHLMIIDPVSYLDMLVLESEAQIVVTDSGGIQKEAAWLSVSCVTLREETEWVETVDSGWNALAGTEVDQILDAISKAEERISGLRPFPAQVGASEAVARQLLKWII